MAFLDLDLAKKPRNIDLFLAKPSRNVIAKINTSYDKVSTLKLGDINELVFKVPFVVDSNHNLVRNKIVDQFKERYLIKAKVGEVFEWYIITKITDSMDDNNDVKEVHAMLLSYQLKDKIVRAYKEDSKNATQVLTDALLRTSWSVGYIDSDFDLKYRSFDVDSKSVLDFIIEIAQTFDGVIKWDTDARTVSLYKPENVGINRGLRINYGRYLQTLSKESSTEELVTRLYCYGKDQMDISSANPTGKPYLEDYSFFMYPFQRDSNGNVTESSYFMSDSLCHALLDYKDLCSSNQGDFDLLLTQLGNLKAELTDLQFNVDTGLTKLQAELAILMNQLDIANATSSPTSSIIASRNAKQIEVDAKQATVDSKNTEITSKQSEIDSLKVKLDSTSNFTPEQIEEMNEYVIEADWSDENYIEASDLYKDAVKRFVDMKQPSTVINLDLISFLEVIEAQRDWDKLNLGDTITVIHDRLGVEVQAKIIGVEIDYEQGTVKLTIANIKDIQSNEDKLIKMLYNSVSYGTTVSMNKNVWTSASSVANSVDSVINNIWDATKRSIQAGTNESVDISSRGITVRNPDDPNNYVVIQHGVIAISNDNGDSWKHAITPTGIVAERLFGKIIAGENLTIDMSDDTGTKLFTVDSTGVTIAGTSLTVTGGVPETQINGTSVSKWNSSEINAKQYTDDQLVTVNQVIDDLSDDNKLTGFEKQQAKQQWDTVFAEKPTIVNQATAYNVSTTNYVVAYQALADYLNNGTTFVSGIPALLADVTKTSDIVGSTFRDKFKTYFNERTILLKNLSDKAVQIGTAYNGVVIDTTNGLVVTKSDNKVKTTLNATQGIKIQYNDGTNWIDRFYVDASTGNLMANAIITDKLIMKSGSTTLIDASTKTIDFSGFTFKSGQLDAANMQLKGVTVTNASGATTFAVDSDGNLTLSGNITMSGGSITWANVTKPTYTASDVGALATSSPKLTNISSTGIYTGTLEANQINVGTLNGFTINGGTINVTSDVYVGNNIYLQNSGTRKIVFNGSAQINSYDSLNLTLSASNINVGNPLNVNGNSVTIASGASLYLTGVTVYGLNTTAKFG